jgi:NADH-quinone oxidoreductase subunit M
MHRWLVVAGDQAPTSALVLLIGVGTKIGCYGLARFCVPLFPNVLPSAVWWLSIVAIAGSMYGALVSLAQVDLRKLAVYAAISHQGLCASGILSLNLIGISGGLLHALGQGLCFAALVFLIDALQRRHGSVEVAAYGGLAFSRPRFSFCILVVCLGATAAPGLCGFVGQTLTLLGVLRGHPAIGPRLGLAAIGLITQAVLAWALLSFAWRCLLGRYSKAATGPASSTSSNSPETPDLSAPEVATLLPALLLIFSIGIWPNFFLERIDPTVSRMLHAYGTTIADKPPTANNGDEGPGATVSGPRNTLPEAPFSRGGVAGQSETEATL